MCLILDIILIPRLFHVLPPPRTHSHFHIAGAIAGWFRWRVWRSLGWRWRTSSWTHKTWLGIRSNGGIYFFLVCVCAFVQCDVLYIVVEVTNIVNVVVVQRPASPAGIYYSCSLSCVLFPGLGNGRISAGRIRGRCCILRSFFFC